MKRTAIWLTLLACTLAGCAGYRGGWESVAYIGDAPPSPIEPATSAYERNQRPPLGLPGMSLHVSIDNRVRDYDTQVWLFAVPVKVDPRNVPTSVATRGKTRVRLAITPTQPGLVFSPREAVLTIGTTQYQAVDLSRALRAPGLAEAPLIRFAPVRWREGYT
jgi:hypothetical protein